MSLMNNLHLQIFDIRWALLTPGFWRLPHLQDSFWRYYAHDRDGASVCADGTWYALHHENAYLIPAGVALSTDTQGEVGQLYVHFALLGLPDIASRQLFDQPICVTYEPQQQATLSVLAQEIASGISIDLTHQCQVKALIFAALANYLTLASPERISRCLQFAENVQPVLPAIRYIETHLAAPISTAILADLCCVTPEYFIRRFHKCTGMTPTHYLHSQRIKQAGQYLAYSELNLDEVAQATGFGNRAYFTRIFTRHTGLPPATYRKALKS